MSLLEILTYPDERLHKVAEKVKLIDSRVKKIAEDMLETMYNANGVGLAATQVDIHERIVVIDVSEERNNPLVLINMKILKKEGEVFFEEGCLSVPGIRENMKRAKKVTVEYLDLEDKKQILEAEGLLAICIQHELDHLDGKVFVDYLSRLKQTRIASKLSKIKR